MSSSEPSLWLKNNEIADRIAQENNKIDYRIAQVNV